MSSFVAIPEGEESPDFEKSIAEILRLHHVVDPETTPYKSKYEARELLKQLLAHEVIAMSQGNTSTSEAGTLSPSQVRLGTIYYYLGLNHVETEETSSGENNLEQCISILGKDPLRFANEIVDSNNQLGIIWCNRSEQTKAYNYLSNAMETYQKRKEYEKANEGVNQSCSEGNVEKLEQLESLHTHTLFYFAQVQGYLGNADLAASYCQQTLERQVETKDYNPVEWVKNVLGLSVYYETQPGEGRRQACHCLDAASTVVEKAIEFIAKDPLRDEEEGQKLKANVLRMRGSFYTNWLRDSSEAVLESLEEQYEQGQRTDTEGSEEQKTASSASASVSSDGGTATTDNTIRALGKPGIKLRMFVSLNLDTPPEFPMAKSFDQARDIFKQALTNYTRALSFFVIDGFVSEHIEIKQSMSDMYRSLAVFENDKSRACKMHKRRINLLEPLVTEVNPNVYQNYFRQMADEVARCYAEMVDLKYMIQKETGNTSEESTNKINSLAMEAIKYHRIFLKSFNKKTGELPSNLDEELQGPYVRAKFQVARMFSRMYNENVPTMMNILFESLREYTSLLEWVKQTKSQVCPQEVLIAQQLVELLPLKIQKMKLTGKTFRDWEI